MSIPVGLHFSFEFYRAYRTQRFIVARRSRGWTEFRSVSRQPNTPLHLHGGGVPGNADKALVVPLHNPFSASREAALSGI
jgi:hypothetical protein